MNPFRNAIRLCSSDGTAKWKGVSCHRSKSASPQRRTRPRRTTIAAQTRRHARRHIITYLTSTSTRVYTIHIPYPRCSPMLAAGSSDHRVFAVRASAPSGRRNDPPSPPCHPNPPPPPLSPPSGRWRSNLASPSSPGGGERTRGLRLFRHQRGCRTTASTRRLAPSHLHVPAVDALAPWPRVRFRPRAAACCDH